MINKLVALFSLIIIILSPVVVAESSFGVLSSVTVVSLKEEVENITYHKGKTRLILPIEKEVNQTVVLSNKTVENKTIEKQKEELKESYSSMFGILALIIISVLLFLLLFYALRKSGLKHFEEHWLDIIFKRNVNAEIIINK